MFKIETLYRVGCGSNWEELPDQDGYATREEAEAAIESLRQLGSDWQDAEYRITEYVNG